VRFGGDERPGIRALREMARVRAYYDAQTRDDIIPGSCVQANFQQCPNGLGDWAAPTGSTYGAALDSTAWWLDMLRVEHGLALRARDEQAARATEARRSAVLGGFERAFYDSARGYYRDPFSQTPGDFTRPGAPPPFSQHQNAMALALDLVPAERRQAIGDALAADVREHGDHLTTGIMGTRFLFAALAETGHVDEAISVLTQTTYPSYGYWLDKLGWHGLGEYWEDNSRSRNHQMYGSVVQWLYEGLAGYRPIAPGWEEIEFRPDVPSRGIDRVSASTETIRGRVATRWERAADGRVELEVTVPPNATGSVHVPGERDARHVGSGTHRFAGHV